ncbi:MAG TPA: hypothetical protein VFU88_21640 [Ktedonobacterales bacterium]|jgi:hypothetical protein|nr:hypothetical protein [Ktedonobacterales bacterium]
MTTQTKRWLWLAALVLLAIVAIIFGISFIKQGNEVGYILVSMILPASLIGIGILGYMVAHPQTSKEE